MMRILTVQQPAAGAIASLGKDVENRTWGIKLDKPINLAIHAGMKDMPNDHPFWEFQPYVDALAAATAQQRDSIDHHGMIIAVAELYNTHEAFIGCCDSHWAERTMWTTHWVLDNIRPLSTPVKFTGGLGLRNVPEEVEHEVLVRA